MTMSLLHVFRACDACLRIKHPFRAPPCRTEQDTTDTTNTWCACGALKAKAEPQDAVSVCSVVFWLAPVHISLYRAGQD